MGSSVQLGYPAEFILLCIAAGFLYAFILYKKKAPWSRQLNGLLFGLRWVLVTILAVLLLSPVLRQIRNYTERPALVIAVDNSASISEVYDSTELISIARQIEVLRERFEDSGYLVNTQYLDGSDELSFDAQRSNINQMLQDIRNDYEGRNLQEVILLSDGLFNEGASPAYSTFPFRLTTVGLGDSIPKKDVRIETVTYNKVAYEGNKFPVVVSVFQNGYNGQSTSVIITRDGREEAREVVDFANNPQTDVTILLDADRKGMQRYTIRVQSLPEEFIPGNNEQDAYIEVIEGKQKICLVAAAPHPDLSSIVEALNENSNYEVEQYILSINEDREEFMRRNKPTDLYILHQLPNLKNPVNWVDKLKDASVFFMYGPQTDLNGLNTMIPYFDIQAYPGEFDQVMAIMNPSYAPFTFSDSFLRTMGEFPPLVVPFGEISASGDAQVMLFQKIGSIETRNPLLLTSESGEFKHGLLIGSGIWQWKLADYARNKANANFNEFIQKLVQYLSTRADKRRFRLYPIKDEYTEGEDVVFETEVYNELYERVYGNRVSLSIINSDGEEQNFSYVTSENSTRYTVSGLTQGVYRYSGTTDLDGSQISVSGEFVVKKLDLESLRLTADFNLLRQVAGRNGGNFYQWNQEEQLAREFSGREAQGIIFSEEKYLSAINLTWLLIALLVLITTEWVIRKYHGSY